MAERVGISCPFGSAPVVQINGMTIHRVIAVKLEAACDRVSVVQIEFEAEVTVDAIAHVEKKAVE